jgi:O-antigen/teichoic acid export membrane protein
MLVFAHKNNMHTLSWNYIKEKWNHEGFQKYFKNTGWMFISRILCMAVSFLTTLYIARKLGPTNYGQLNYSISFISIFSFIATLGIDNVLYRDIIKILKRKKNSLVQP